MTFAGLKKTVLLVGNVVVWIILVALLGLIIEGAVSVTRGYGFFTGPSRFFQWPDFEAFSCLHYIGHSINNKGQLRDNWPKPSYLDENLDCCDFHPDSLQEKFGIYQFDDTEGHFSILYSRVSTFEPKCDNALFVVACLKGFEYNGTYVKFTGFPRRIIRSIPNEWLILSSDGVVSRYSSKIPPLPGCIVVYTGKYSQGQYLKKVYYSQDLLPAMHALYPQTQIPEDLLWEN